MKPVIQLCLFFFIVPALAFGSTLKPEGVEEKPFIGPLYREATNEFSRLKLTRYQHETHVNVSEGSYCYDCVGFVSYALKTATPRAWASVVRAAELPPHRIPSPPRYRTFFAGLIAHPEPGWEAVTNAVRLCPGDVIAWEHKTATAVGHAVIIGSIPKQMADGSWQVEVYDSTSSPHDQDSRPDDPRAHVLASSGRRSGLGHGVMFIVGDQVTGALTGLRWSSKSKVVTVPIAAGRPID